ncbi:MAG TPA: hypothetical protein VFU13_19270 [Steroidobacteraceae bacterium]|nr:hypothetical protein [Steroidobacteraceae bacterium]
MAEYWDDYGTNADLPCVMDMIPGPEHANVMLGISTFDAAPYINQALARYRMIRLPLRGQLSVGSPLVVPSGGAIYGYNYQCTIKALPNFGNNPVIRNAFTNPTSDAARDKNLTFVGFRIDGNRANNPSATEFAHGVKLCAVDGCVVDLQVVDVKGDGLLILYADYPHGEIGCRAVYGRMRTQGCGRHGVAVICGEQINIDIIDEGSSSLSLDIEPDEAVNFVRNCMFRVISKRTGGGADVSGGFCVAGDGLGSRPTNITVDFEVFESGAYGGLWRDAVNLTLRGSIINPRLVGLVGVQAGSGPSSVFFDGVRVVGGGNNGMSARETVGSVYDGSLYIDGATGMAAQIENLRGGILQMRAENCGQQGVYLNNCQNVTFPNLVTTNNRGTNLWLRGGSSGNRFPNLKSMNCSAWGFLEDPGCNDNKATQARVSGNTSGNVAVSGASSYVAPEA